MRKMRQTRRQEEFARQLAENQENTNRDLQQADSIITNLRATLLQEQNARTALDNAVKTMTNVMEQQNKIINEEAASMQSVYDAQLQQVRSQQEETTRVIQRQCHDAGEAQNAEIASLRDQLELFHAQRGQVE